MSEINIPIVLKTGGEAEGELTMAQTKIETALEESCSESFKPISRMIYSKEAQK